MKRLIVITEPESDAARFVSDVLKDTYKIQVETDPKEVIRLLGDESLTVSDIYRDAAMVGDRRFDIEAAKNLGLLAVGALYGYGTREELEQAGADHIAEKPEDIAKYC